MRLNAKAMAISFGILWGAAFFLATVWLVITGSAGETLGKMSAFYIGYTVSWGGAFLGLIYGFIDGLIAGFLLVLLYNKFLPKEQVE